ncbi:MAG: metalloregulator ArsR/SmtB family transcription factor [Phycisphaerae bacterium]|jgi:ArsR family transcriptional regulator|nr:metalloregulator ArsR/SmtB family transcription factor [Phycisphaerae bacterium]
MAGRLDILKALSEEVRLRIFRLISMQELYVNELVSILDISQPRVSRHLAVLKNSGLAVGRREGNWIYYHASDARDDPFAAEIRRTITDHVLDETFFPEDLHNLRDVLDRRKASSTAWFDNVASEWDRIKHNYIQDMLPFMVATNFIQSGAVAADIGTGTGEVLLTLAASAGKVIGVDSSAKMLDVCRDRIAQSGLDNVELRLGDAEALPLDDAECDTVFSSMLLHHLTSPQQGVAEMARVLAPGGKVVIIDLVKHANDWTREVMADLWLGFTEEQIQSYLRDAGFVDLNYSTSTVLSPSGGERTGKLQVFIAIAAKAPSRAEPHNQSNNTTAV